MTKIKQIADVYKRLNWCQGALYRNAGRSPVKDYRENPDSCCLLGACQLAEVHPVSVEGYIQQAALTLGLVEEGDDVSRYSIPTINDSLESRQQLDKLLEIADRLETADAQ